MKRILYATDLGIYSPYILKSLSRLVSASDDQIHVLHVIEPMGVFAESILRTYVSDDSRRHLQRHGLSKVMGVIKEQVIDTLESEYKDILSGFELKTVDVELGNPAKVIVEQAERLKVDMIVMGSRGQYSLTNTALGSVTNKVLQWAVIPVVVIPMMGVEELDRLT